MKKLSTVIFLLLSVSFIARAQQINTVEYFFDTDPGFGQGKKIIVNSNSLDSNFTFDVTGLSTGIHTLYARLKNSNNNWSSIYQNPIQVLNGTAGPAVIVAAEYFFDKDPGFGNGQQLTLATATLDSTLNFSMNGLTAGLHTIFVRLKNNSSVWSSVYQGTILVSNGAAGSVKITAAEYFFDTDPGFGLGTQIGIDNNAIDSVINFNINGLQPGIHSFYVRFKNTDNNWSFASQGNFIVFNGTSGTPQIQSLNYFIDSVKNTVSIPLNATALLDTTLSIAIPDNGHDQAILGLRVANQTGSTGNAALNTISLCDLYKPQGGFRFAQYGGTFTLIDTSHFNDSQKIRWLANNLLLDSNYTINYQLPIANIPGSTIITELTGTGCRVDTIRKTFSMPGVERFAPYVGSYGSDFDLNLYGAGLDSTLNVFLQFGSTKVYPYMKIPADGNQHLIAVFDFHNYAKTFGNPEIRDNYSLHVIYPTGYEYISDPSTPIAMEKQEDNTKIICAWPVLPIGFRCPQNQLIRIPDPQYQAPDSVAEPYFATDLTGPANMRTGVWNNFTMSITNTGTVVAKGIPFYIMVPASFDIDTAKWNIINPYPGLRDSISIITPIDTIINGRHLQYKLIAMIYPLLAPGETGYFPLRLRTNLTTPYHIYYTAQSRMFGSPMTYLFGPCWGAVLDFGIGFLPGISCLYAFGNLINDQINFGLKNSHSNGDWFSLGLSYAGTAVSCIPGGGPLAQFAKATGKEMGFFKAGLGELEAMNVADKGLGVISNVNSAAGSSDPCSRVKQTPKDKNGQPVASFDPNYIVGNSDYDSAKHYINNYSSQYYTIGFENKPAATADAQHVYISDTLNPAKFYLKTFTMSQFFIGDSTYSLPPYRYQVTKDVAIKYRKDMKVRFTATFDTLQGILKADFFSIDTLGHLFPLDSVAGFLPPNIDGVSGTAGLSYSLYIQNLNTLDTFMNKASIYFDNNAPIVTNAWQNTVDTTRPVGQIAKAIIVNDSTSKLIMQGADVGAGLSYYTFYVKSSTDSLFRKIGLGTGDTILFKGQPNQTYQVFSKSTDYVGNVQIKDSVADISITFTTGSLPVHLLTFSGNKETRRIRLLWTSADETNFSHYTVEKSADGRIFSTLAVVNARGGQLNNNYQLYDEHPFVKNNYYRLKQVDNDNQFTYSKIVRIDFDKKYTLNCSPDPAHDYVVISGAENFSRIDFIDLSGKTVKQFSSAPGNKFNISSLNPGMYFIRLSSNEDMKVLKLIKQ